MKKLALILPLMLGMSACKSDSEQLWDDYSAWRDANNSWLNEQVATGKYETVVPAWNSDIKVYRRWLSDRDTTAGNLSPLYTSTVTVSYTGWLYDGTQFDSSFKTATDTTANLRMNSVIPGWVAAMEGARVGDKMEIIVPYDAAYGSGATGVIKPFSTLRFEIKLEDIPNYEIRP